MSIFLQLIQTRSRRQIFFKTSPFSAIFIRPGRLSSVDILFVSTRRSCLVTVFYSTTITKPRDSHPHFLCPITDISLSDNLYYTPAFTVSGRHPFSSRLHILTSSTSFCPREFSSVSTCRDTTLDPSFTKFETFVCGSN